MKLWKFFLTFSLRTKLVASFAITILLTAGVGLVGFRSALGKFHHQSGERLVETAGDLGASIAWSFYERYGDAQAFSKNLAIKNMDAAEAQIALSEYIKIYQIYDLILLLDLKGKVVSVNSFGPKGNAIDIAKLRQTNFSEAEWYQKAISEKYTVDKEYGIDGTYVSEIKFLEETKLAFGEAQLGQVFSTLVKDKSGQPKGVIANFANASYFEDHVKEYYLHFLDQQISEAEIKLVDGNGILIVDYDPSHNSGNLDVVRDRKTITVENITEVNLEYSDKLKVKAKGFLESHHEKTLEKQWVGFSPIHSKHFPKSIGWSVVIGVPDRMMLGTLSNASFQFSLSMTIITLMILGGALIFSRSISNSLGQIVGSLEMGVQQAKSTSELLFSAAESLNSSSLEQAAAVQESVSSLSEMASMISQSSQSSETSQKSVMAAIDKTVEGQQTMERLRSSMDGVSQAEEELDEIQSVIDNIKTRTQAINEIVFKTQILSFNASIEAARAGHTGRGFAVVAEEVAVLAETSGASAREIEDLIATSSNKVRDIVEKIHERVSSGQSVVKEAEQNFQKISADVQNINQQVKSVATAAKQQELGVKQSHESMRQIDRVTHNQSTASSQTRVAAESLKKESESLFQSMRKLKSLVEGSEKRKVA